MEELGFDISEIRNTTVSYELLKNKIESYVGSTEIPLGLAGPMLFNFENNQEHIHTLIATLEGTLVASVNRGAKLISINGGVSTSFIHQKMTRAPLFLFETDEDRDEFEDWIADSFKQIKKVSESYSNHAQLIEVVPMKTDKALHVKFVYTTGDASGQNMTTTCTWHAVLWLVSKFSSETGIHIKNYVIEGNAASDKKVSMDAIENGRGVSVSASCMLSEESIVKHLRTTSEKLLSFFEPSMKTARQNGMVGYNINVANAIAGIYLATGQDMGSVHESSVAYLNISKNSEGLNYQLTIPNLVIGTIGGGTSLPKQAEALNMMGCEGQGKVERFAQIIAGFSLALEISTFGAIVSGQFAKSHEMLSRNKPTDWLVRAEINTDLIKDCLQRDLPLETITQISISDDLLDNGLLTEIAKRVTNKLIGFVPLQVQTSIESAEIPSELLIKSKPLDIEIIKGLHNLAASLDIGLADMIRDYKDILEYHNTHLKEPWITNKLCLSKFPFSPKYYGNITDQRREIHMIVMERLRPASLCLIDSENHPEKWTQKLIMKSIMSITQAHHLLSKCIEEQECPIVESAIWKAEPLYRKLLEVIIMDGGISNEQEHKWLEVMDSIENMESDVRMLDLPKAIIHNDFNPRNVAIRNDGTPCIYDWELSTLDIPHRDVVEMLSYTLPSGFVWEDMAPYLDYHFVAFHDISGHHISKEKWFLGYEYALRQYLISRLTFLKTASLIIPLKFIDRVLENTFQMYDMVRLHSSTHQRVDPVPQNL